MDGLLKRVGQVLVDDRARRSFLKRAFRWTRWLVGLLTFGYAGLLLLSLALFRGVGEQNLTVAFLLYLPRALFLAPALFLLPPAILFHRLSALTLVLAGSIFVFSAMDFRPRTAPEPDHSAGSEVLTVLTYNRGQHAGQSLQPFKNRVSPDLVVLQEAPRRAQRYVGAEGYEEFSHAQDLGEFTLLSRHPIVSAAPVELGTGPERPVAARFVVETRGRQIAVYAVHTVSPRDTLLHYRRGAFLYGLIGIPGTPFSARREANQAYWDDRIEQARRLRDAMGEDPLPTVIAGDFNAPAGGYIHALFRQSFEDAHLAAGHGFGYTFPGTSRNPLSGGGPWMRIDYLFCDEHWETVWCITEPDRPSQHRAVAARFRLVK